MPRYIDADKFEKDIVSLPYGYRGMVRSILFEQPTADVVEVRHGKWIDAWRCGFDGIKYWHRECSECGYERDDDNLDKDTNYCPTCGARMEIDE